MAIEIEKKYRLNAEQREQIFINLKEIGAKFVGEDFEENTLYRGGILDEKHAVLRVRKIDDKTILTYKEPVPNSLAFKQQIEYETSVENAEEIEKIIENLGFTKALVYEKRRKIWHFRDVEIVLDELPFGLYMEIEGSVTAIAEAEMFLEIENIETEYETYPRLTQRFGVQKERLIEARFS
jgi:adenylate cyclase class 2